MAVVGQQTPLEALAEQRAQAMAMATHDPDLVPAAVRTRDGLPAIDPKVTLVGEHLRQKVPGDVQCSMFCGGKRCKYESPDAWKTDEMAINGFYSHWVTPDLLAMSRPNTAAMKKFNLLDQFRQLGIRSVVNLQTPFEHASCGPGLEASGFTYDPADLMKDDVFFYNFAWRDHSDATMARLSDMVKVLSFALSQGRVAIHCHAGLGRTGVLLACYLVFALRVRSNDALRYVRMKRPGAVQTRTQIDCVKAFESHFLPQCLVFSTRPVGDNDRRAGRFTLDNYLKRQKHVLHGYDARALKRIPKLVFRIGERLLRLCDCGPAFGAGDGDGDPDGETFVKSFLAYTYDTTGPGKMTSNGSSSSLLQLSASSSLASTRGSSRTTFGADSASASSSSSSALSALSGVDDRKLDEILDDGVRGQTLQENSVARELASREDLRKALRTEALPRFSVQKVYEAMLMPHGDIIRSLDETSSSFGVTMRDVDLLQQYHNDLNVRISAWDRIEAESNLFVLTALLYEWLEHLREPVLDKDNITYLVIHCDSVETAMRKLPPTAAYLTEYSVRLVARLQPLPRACSENLLKRLMASLTHQGIAIDGVVHPASKNFPKLRGGTAQSTLKFLMRMLDIVSGHIGAGADTALTSSFASTASSSRTGSGASNASSLDPIASNYRLRHLTSGFNSLDGSAASGKGPKVKTPVMSTGSLELEPGGHSVAELLNGDADDSEDPDKHDDDKALDELHAELTAAKILAHSDEEDNGFF